MNQFTPKSDFKRRRALSLHKSGESNREIARRLGLVSTTVDRWVKALKPRLPAITEAIDHAEKMNAIRWAGSELRTCAYVPQIKLTSKSKYQMRQA